MKPGDIVFFEDTKFGFHRFWVITACCYGSIGQESLIRMRSLSERPGTDENLAQHEIVTVPEPMVRGLRVFSQEDGI